MFIRHKKLILSGLATVWLGVAPVHALVENFSSDPFATWSFGVGNNSSNQFVWNSGAAPVYTGDATGSLGTHLNSSYPSARLQTPLGVTVTDTDSFTLKTRFSFHIDSAPDDDFFQMAFGLINSSLTGPNRTELPFNSFHTVEFDYYPNVSPTFGYGATLTPSVFGAQVGGSIFNNFASIFGSGSDLGDNATLTALPQDVTLEAILNYSGSAKVLTLTMNQVNPDGSLTLLDTEVPPMDLVALGYNTNSPFVVNSLAIMAYHDGFQPPGGPQLIADLTFQQFEFITTVPEPSTVALLGLGGVLAILRRREAA